MSVIALGANRTPRLFTLYIKSTFSGEVTGSCWLFSSHFSYAWNEMKNQLLTFPNKSITLEQLLQMCFYIVAYAKYIIFENVTQSRSTNDKCGTVVYL